MSKDLSTRIGFIRVSGLTWERQCEDIKRAIGKDNLVNVLQSIRNSRYINSVDVIFANKDFDPIGPHDEYPQYDFEFEMSQGRPVKVHSLRRIR
jgi:hypothetical protein